MQFYVLKTRELNKPISAGTWDLFGVGFYSRLCIWFSFLFPLSISESLLIFFNPFMAPTSMI